MLQTLSESAYSSFLQKQLKTPLWQSLDWKGYQNAIGRETRLYGLKNAVNKVRATALVIIDRTIGGFCTWDIPRGPIGDENAISELIILIAKEAKKERCFSLFYSPEQQCHLARPPKPSVGWGVAREMTSHHHGSSDLTMTISSPRHEQPESTLIINLTQSEEDILKQMKPKGRYNIRVAEKHGVNVEKSDDVDSFYDLLRQTSERDGFSIKPKKHYEEFLKNIPDSFLLLAFSKPNKPINLINKPIAALLGTTHNNTGIYYYGASDSRHRALMAPYLLQWEAIKYCKEKICQTYDLLGIASNDDTAHPWTGITRFKKQFGGSVVTYTCEREVILRPMVRRVIGWKRNVRCRFIG